MNWSSTSPEISSRPAWWAELVTTALLGTDRRPLDSADPATTVLRRAARHQVLARLAAPSTLVGPRPDPAPPQDRPEAPEAADLLLADLVRAPNPALICYWLTACHEHGHVVAAVHWTPLARLAARSSAYDRAVLGQALGPRGRWFLHQNQDWRRLAADADPTTEQPAAVPAAEPASPPVTADDVLADAERIFTAPLPWGPDLVSAGYAVLGGQGTAAPRGFATSLGMALPAELYPTIAQAAAYYLLDPEATPSRRRTIRDRFVALELAAYARAAIHHAFTGEDTGLTRAEIPNV